MVGRGWMARIEAVDGSHEADSGGGGFIISAKQELLKSAMHATVHAVARGLRFEFMFAITRLHQN
jgi:hypothetical protein